MATKLRKLRITRVDRVYAPANGTDADGPLARIVLAKARDDIRPPATSTDPGGGMPTETEQLDQLRKAIDEAVAAAVAPVQDELTQVKETYASEKADFEAAVAATADPTEVDKAALPESVRKRLEDAEAVAKAAEERVAKMEHDREAARWLEVAKGLPFVAVSKAVGGDAAAETGALLHSIAKAAGEEPAGQLLGMLEAAQAKLAQSELLKEAGRAGAPPADGAEAQLQKAADDIRKAAPELTPAQAYAQAVAGNPALAIKAQQEELTRA